MAGPGVPLYLQVERFQASVSAANLALTLYLVKH
jgi:hypothetical protein